MLYVNFCGGASKQIPRRLGYPTKERDLNGDNYKLVATQLNKVKIVMTLVFGGIKNSFDLIDIKSSSKGEFFFVIKDKNLTKIHYFYQITNEK
jgi:hypothetical protein